MILPKFLNVFRKKKKNKKKKIKNGKIGENKSKNNTELKNQEQEKIEDSRTFEPWNQLPDDLKLECIKRMPIFTKFILCQTSWTERNLVLGSFYKNVTLMFKNEVYDGWPDLSEFHFKLNEKENYFYSSNLTKAGFNQLSAKLLSYFINYATVESLKMQQDSYTLDKVSVVVSKLKLKKQCQIKNVEFSGTESNGTLPFLKMCSPDSISSVEVCTNQKNENFLDELFQMPALNSTKTWKINNLNCKSDQASWTIASYLLKAKAEVGTKVEFTLNKPNWFKQYDGKEMLMQSEDFSKKVILETIVNTSYILSVVGSDTEV